MKKLLIPNFVCPKCLGRFWITSNLNGKNILMRCRSKNMCYDCLKKMRLI